MKSDSYLNLCIEQAYLSPLHYRHGCVVVKGGKVIGQGFNDYRPGYDGGSILKSGALPKTAFPFSEGKKKKMRNNYHQDEPKRPDSGTKFKPVEALSGNCGGGHHANARLSMHSEMMAINSALTSSSTLAANTVSCVKPCFKLPGDTKRKRERRAEALAAYVRAICFKAEVGPAAAQVQQRSSKAQAEEWRFEPSAYRFAGLSSEDGSCASSESESWSSESESERRRDVQCVREEEGSVQAWAQVQQVQVV